MILQLRVHCTHSNKANLGAKVTRDSRLRKWQFKEKDISVSTRFGSGYPSDPTTKEWLRNNMDPVFGFPSLLRFSWKTSSVLLEQGAVDIFWDQGDMEEEGNYDDYKVKDRADRYRYFAENNMELVMDFE